MRKIQALKSPPCWGGFRGWVVKGNAYHAVIARLDKVKSWQSTKARGKTLAVFTKKALNFVILSVSEKSKGFGFVLKSFGYFTLSKWQNEVANLANSKRFKGCEFKNSRRFKGYENLTRRSPAWLVILNSEREICHTERSEVSTTHAVRFYL